MAIAIAGKTAIAKGDFTGEVTKIQEVYTLSGHYTGNDVRKTQVKWFGDNLMDFNPKIGDWTTPIPAYTGLTTSDVKAQYYPWVNKADKDLEVAYLAKVNDKTKLTLEFTKDHWTQHINNSAEEPHMANNEIVRLEVSAFDTAGVEGATGFNVSFSNTSDEAEADYIMKAGVPVDGADEHTPVYVVHESDVPPVTEIVTPFYSTYPSPRRDYIHRIVYSGDSSFFWDSGQDVLHDDLTTTANYFEATLNVHDWAPHADYTGYTTVSATGSVIHRDFTVSAEGVDKLVAQDGYLIFIEYHTGTAIRVRVLRADEEHLITNMKNEAIRTNDDDDNGGN